MKQSDGTVEELQEDEVLFEKTNEYLVKLATTSVQPTQATTHNLTTLNEKLSQAEYKNIKLKDEIINLREEMNKQRKVDNNMIPLKENILEQQEHPHDVKVECFTEIQKMAEKIKALEKHLQIVSQINLKMESLQVKIQELDIWWNMEKSVPSSL